MSPRTFWRKKVFHWRKISLFHFHLYIYTYIYISFNNLYLIHDHSSQLIILTPINNLIRWNSHHLSIQQITYHQAVSNITNKQVIHINSAATFNHQSLYFSLWNNFKTFYTNFGLKAFYHSCGNRQVTCDL